jgi:ankyrin repeat protein
MKNSENWASAWDFLSATEEKTGQTIDWRLHDAAMTGNIELAEKAIADGVDINSNYLKQRATPLHLASANGFLNIAILLVRHKAQINISDEMGWTPITIAAEQNNGDIVAFLYGQGATLSAEINGDEVYLDEEGIPDGALLLGAELGELDAVHRALDRGADINCRLQDDGWTSLLMATKKDGEEMVRSLLARGADPNAASNTGYTPLMRAAGHGEIDLVSILLDANCDISARAKDGQTAYSMAMHEGQFDAAELIAHRLGMLSRQAGHNRVILEGQYASIMMLAPHSSKNYHLVCVEFDDGTKLQDAKVFDKCALELPSEYTNKKIDKLSINLHQP